MAGRSWEGAGEGALVMGTSDLRCMERRFSVSVVCVMGEEWEDEIIISIICGLETTLNDTTVAVISWDLLLEARDEEPLSSSSENMPSKPRRDSESS